MPLLEKIKLLLHILRWRMTWARRNLDYLRAETNNEKFMTARQAVSLIPDEACVFSNGFAGNARCSVFFWALREQFLKTGKPRNLTWINVAAQGGRGKVPGTIEEIALPGLMRKYISGHLETTKAQLRLAQAGQLEIYTMPQGVMTQLIQAQAEGKNTIYSKVGKATFLDPECGSGASVTPGANEKFIEHENDLLKYRLPLIEFVLMNAPFADTAGNIYFHHASIIAENLQSVKATKANGGKVMVTVAKVIPKNDALISIGADWIDIIVVHPYNEQATSVPQLHYWPMFTEGAEVNEKKAERQLKFINDVLKITPVRSKIDAMLARIGAQLFARNVKAGDLVNIGVGYPEEVASILMKQDFMHQLTFTTEAGAYGGIPMSGIFFGAAINPKKIISSFEMFQLYEKKLAISVLGFLQVDEKGNVNASLRGPAVTDFVGPGGMPDITYGARKIIFIGSWMTGAKYKLENGKLKIIKPGKPKFVKQVDQVTFHGMESLRQQKEIYYVTHIGILQLTEKGLVLISRMPGMDTIPDIIENCPAEIHIPEQLPEIDLSVILSDQFKLAVSQ